jgi:hypothetical protein
LGPGSSGGLKGLLLGLLILIGVPQLGPPDGLVGTRTTSAREGVCVRSRRHALVRAAGALLCLLMPPASTAYLANLTLCTLWPTLYASQANPVCMKCPRLDRWCVTPCAPVRRFMWEYLTLAQIIKIGAWANLVQALGAPMRNLLVYMTAAPLLSAFRCGTPSHTISGRTRPRASFVILDFPDFILPLFWPTSIP